MDFRISNDNTMYKRASGCNDTTEFELGKNDRRLLLGPHVLFEHRIASGRSSVNLIAFTNLSTKLLDFFCQLIQKAMAVGGPLEYCSQEDWYSDGNAEMSK